MLEIHEGEGRIPKYGLPLKIVQDMNEGENIKTRKNHHIYYIGPTIN